MQNRRAYCSYCCAHYDNLEQHTSSAQHRYSTTQSRQRMGTASLMERFLQDVLRHHPYHCQESRSMQNERHTNIVSPPEVVPINDFVPEEITEDAAGFRGEMSTKGFGPTQKLYSRPRKSQEYIQSVSIRPSVIQKLEKGQQRPLELIREIGDSRKELNPVVIGEATNSGHKLPCPSVISDASASCLPARSRDGPVTTTGLPLAALLNSVSKHDPNKVDRCPESLDRGSRNPMLSSPLETSSVSYQKTKESNKKSSCINSDKLIIKEDVKSQGKTLSTGFKFPEFVGTEGCLKFESLSKLAVNPAINPNEIDMASDKGIFEDGIPKRHEKFFSNLDCTREAKHLVFNKSVLLEQKNLVSSEMKFDCSSLHSVSDQPQDAVQDLWNEEQIDQEDKNCELRGSEMSFDCTYSFHSLTDQLKGTSKEINLSKEVHADLQDKNNKSCVSEVSSDCSGSLQLATNRTQVIVKDTSFRKAMHISLVGERYASSDSEINFDCGASLQSTDDYLKQPAKEINLPKEVHVGLVDKDYGSSSSEISADSVFLLQSVLDPLPVAVTETKLRKKIHIGLVGKNYGSSCSETSFDCGVSLQSVVDHPQLAVKERHLKDRRIYLRGKNHKPSDVSLETVTDEPQRAVEEINLLKEKHGLVDMDCESHGPEMSFHTGARLVVDQSQIAVKERNCREVAIDQENKSGKSSVSDLSFDSHASFDQLANHQPERALGEINLKELNVDMEVKSYGGSSSELTFDSDPPLLSVTEHSGLDVEEIRKRHSHLGDESYESNSSEMTFDSDIPFSLVVDQSQVAVYEEELTHLENKSNESCVSEITFDSDIPLHSGTDQPEVAVKEIIIQKEECVHLERENDEPSGSEISLGSCDAHSMTRLPEAAVQGLNLHKEEHVHLENRGNGPSVSEISLKSAISLHLVTDHPDIAVKEINHQKEEHVNLEDKGNELSVSETSLDCRIPLQSATYKPGVVVTEIRLQKEKHAKIKGRSAEFSSSEVDLDSDVSHCSVAELQVVVKEMNVRKEEHVVLENKSDKCSGSEIIVDSDVPPQSMTEKPRIAVLREHHVDPEDESPESRGFEINLDISAPPHSLTDQPQLALWKEKHVDVEDRLLCCGRDVDIDVEDPNSEPRDCKISFDSKNPALQPLTEQFQEAVRKPNLCKEEGIGLENKVDGPSGSKLIHDSDVSLQPQADQPEVALEGINLENEDHVYLEDKGSQYSGSEMSLDSDFLVQSIIDQPQITILEQEHLELEDKHKESCGSEMSFDSDDPFQSVADQLRDTVQEISLWKDEVDVEGKRDESKGFEIVYDSGVPFQSVAGQTGEVVKEMDLWKEHVDLEDKIVEPSDSKINFDSDEPLQCVADEIQEAVTETNPLREGHVCVDGENPGDSEFVYVSNVPPQSAVEHPHGLEGEHASLDDKSSDPCDPEINFASDDPLQSVADRPQKAVKGVSLWREDRVYLAERSYKLADFEVSYDSDVPVHVVADQSPVAGKEMNLQKRDPNDLENKDGEPSVSEVKCDSGVHLQLELERPQVVCNEVSLRKEEHLGMEERTSEPCDSEIMCDSDVPLQIVINDLQVSLKETNPKKMLLVDVVTSGSDCEMISDSDITFKPTIDSPRMTVKGMDCINVESFDPEGEGCDSSDRDLGYVCEAPPRLVTNPSKETFKVVNRKKDYIILEESSCECYGSEINFQIDASHQSMTYQSQGPDKKIMKYIDPEDKSCGSNSPKRNFRLEATSQPVTHQLQKADKEVSLWKDLENIGLKDKNCESSVSAMDCKACPESATHQMTDTENLLKLKPTDLGSMCYEPCGSAVNFQCDPSLWSDTNQTQEVVNKTLSFDTKETNHNSHLSSVPVVDSIRNLEEAKGIMEDNPDEPVLEDLPHVPPSFVGKTWSQIMREDDIKINALVKEFKEGRFHCYFDDDCETRNIKKKNLNEGKKSTWADLDQDTASIQVLSECDANAGGVLDLDAFSVAFHKPSHHSTAKMPSEQTWRVASRCQAVKVSHGTQTNLMRHPATKRKFIREDEDSPVRKDRKTKKVKIGTVEFPDSCVQVMKPLQPNALVYVLSSNIKLKEGESFNLSKMRRQRDVNNRNISIRYKYKQSSFSYYDPLSKQIIIDPSLNLDVPESHRTNHVRVPFSDLNSSAEGDGARGQSSASAYFVSVRHGLMPHQRASRPSVFLEKSEILNASDVPEESNFQLTLLNCDAAKIAPKSVTNKCLESKKKIQRRKVTTHDKPVFPQKAYGPIVLQQGKRITSEQHSIWIRTKLNDIIKKYISKYSVFLRHKYQSRSTFLRTHLKKKTSDVSGLTKRKRAAQMLLDSSVPSAGAEEHVRPTASPSRKQPARDPSSAAASKRNGKKRSGRKGRKPPRPVRIYALRSLCSQVPYK
uniref:Zinc finger DBF-type containing 2 n=1 Tax=Equus caballus TaxID=9796 RepID=A0A3Q2KNS3_HORSE|nr:DBF4-type zinc finger-containing protein 2 [Equus caballus]XP_023478257.1 DBF4-type zinc finger-containing protein 2 [Equus caballus]XP_023478258.1 DBF4-type zinc finger-containing protein 2 [Equus caballus]